MTKLFPKLLSLALALLMLAGCASTPVSFQWPEMEGFIEGVPALLSYSEMVGEGQKDAAAILLLGTLLSVVTLPVMSLLLPLLG